jgi:hypothetical protein
MYRLSFLVAFMMGCLLFHSQDARALFFTQGMYGFKNSSMLIGERRANLSGTEFKGTFYFDPVPMVPAAVGGALFYSKVEGSAPIHSMSGWGLDLEAVGWYPLPQYSITPYFKLGYTPYSSYTIKADGITLDYKPTGFCPSAGIKIDILFRLAVMVELTYRIEKYSDSMYKANDDSITLLVGGQLGI